MAGDMEAMEGGDRHTREKFLVFGAPAIEEAEIAEVVATLRSGWIGTGPRVAQFEEEFRQYKQAPHAVAVNSCTAALHLSLLAAGLGAGDEVITSALTFCATVNAIVHSGATPVLADVDPVTMNISPSEIERRITSNTRAIIPVHFAGRPCDMTSICEIATRHHLKVIEDCAHAIESKYRGQPTGTFGDFGCFSFYVTKNVVTGEGGMVLAREADDAARIKRLALHGMSHDAWKRFSDDGYKHYLVTECGYKYNMMDLQAALGLHQLRRVQANWERRREIWAAYGEGLRGLPLELPGDPEASTRHAYHLYTALIDEQQTGITRDEMLAAMAGRHIGVGVHYLSIPEHPFYQHEYGWRPEEYPHAMRIGRQTMSLPLSARLLERDVERVVAAVHSSLGGQ